MTSQTHPFNWQDLHNVLPFVDMVKADAWLKDCYRSAKWACLQNKAHRAILKNSYYSVTSEQMVNLLKNMQGPLNPQEAQLLLNLISNNLVPEKFLTKERAIAREFVTYARSARLKA